MVNVSLDSSLLIEALLSYCHLFHFFIQSNGNKYYCFDANFGLVLKKSASKSQKNPTRAEMLFLADDVVKPFMESYKDGGKESKVPSVISILLFVVVPGV